MDFKDSHLKSFTVSSNRTVYCIGETVLDIIFRNGQPIAAKPGGSMLNSAVSLGRAGVQVDFISEVACDEAGDNIVNFLHENNVSTNYLSRYEKGKTTIALAFLNPDSDATYSFYSDLPEERLTGTFPVPAAGDILLFGSFFSVSDGIHGKLASFLSDARKNKAIIMYDPNFRTPHLADLPRVMPRILENFALADIIRGSNEDFLHIFASRNADEAYASMKTRNDAVLIFTSSNDPVNIISGGLNISIPVPRIEPISTIGAGDSYNAGVIHALLTMETGTGQVSQLTAPEWENIAKNGIRFSQNVCLSLENYISKDLLKGPGK